MSITTRFTDAHEFTTKSGLCRKAGVSENQLLPVIVKELTDNALDAVEAADGDTASVSIGLLPERNGFFVEDGAGGFSPEALLEFWRVDRGYTSSKRFRLPTRGALGNGLRVVAGAVVAFEAELTVRTRGVQYRIQPRPDGAPLILEEGDSALSRGTRVEIVFPESTSINEGVLSWGRGAIRLSGGGRFKGRTSPHWYGARDLHEIFTGTTGETVAAVVGQFSGCSGAKAGKIAEGYDRIPANEITLEDAGILLSRMQSAARPFKHENMPRIGGETRFSTGEYTTAEGLKIPFSVSVWVEPAEKEAMLFSINRTPSTSFDFASMGNNSISLYIGNEHMSVTSKKPLSFEVNVCAPLVAYTSDGKTPEIGGMFPLIKETVKKAAETTKRMNAESKLSVSKKQAILDALPEAILAASGKGEYEFSQRQLFYSVRPRVIEDAGSEPDYGYFCQILTEYELQNGDIKKLYRDNRGVLYIPHHKGGQEIAIGTRSVRKFKRPKWTFHRIVYCEKEGFFPILRSAKWPEKWDCALLTSKGYASRAVKDLLDVLGEDKDETITVFCVHDCDIDGTLIYQSLQEATASRGARKVEVINLGLDVEDALSMGLPVEPVDRKGSKDPASYVPKQWKSWLQKNRIELNAMSTPQFIEWLDGKMEQYEPAKLIPPEEVVIRQYKGDLLNAINEGVKKEILRDSGYHAKTRRLFRGALEGLEPGDLGEVITSGLEKEPARSWTYPISTKAEADAVS